MLTRLTQNMALAILFGSLGITQAHASRTNQRFIADNLSVTVQSVTGGDPEPISPKILQVILAILHLE